MFTKITDTVAWGEPTVHKQHQRELISAAGRQRLARSVSRNETAFYRLWLGRLGEQLIKWGCSLQAQYGTLTSSIARVETLCQQNDGSVGCQYANIQA